MLFAQQDTNGLGIGNSGIEEVKIMKRLVLVLVSAVVFGGCQFLGSSDTGLNASVVTSGEWRVGSSQ